MKKLILPIIGFLLFQSIYAQKTTTIDWNTDLDFLAGQLSEKHYNLFAKRSKSDFLAEINAIKSATDRLTDLQVGLRLQQLIASMGDSHTSLNITQLVDRNKVLPLELNWLSDGLYIVKTTQANKELLGCRLLSVNGTPVSTVVDSLATLITVDNQAMLKSKVPHFFSFLQLLDYFGFTDEQPVKLGLVTQAGESKTYPIEPVSVNKISTVSFEPESLPFYLKNANVFFTDSYGPEDKIYYLLYNTCWSRELEAKYGNKERAKKFPSFEEFEERAFQTLKKENVGKILFDLRMNGGGYSLQGTEFIEKLASFLKSNPEVKTYVVLGRSTFSSAILNAMDFKRLTNAVFVGEETSGKPNHFGEVKNFKLPTSKLTLNYSTKYFKETDEDVNTIKPDVLIELSFADFAKGIDPVYEWIRKQ